MKLKFKYADVESTVKYERNSMQENMDMLDKQEAVANLMTMALDKNVPAKLLDVQLSVAFLWKTVQVTVYLSEGMSEDESLVIEAINWISSALTDYELKKLITGNGKIQYKWRFNAGNNWDYTVYMDVGDTNLEGCKIVKKRTWSTSYKLEC